MWGQIAGSLAGGLLSSRSAGRMSDAQSKGQLITSISR